MQKPFLSIKEASEYLGVSKDTLRRWHNNGMFRASIVSTGKHRFYAIVDLELQLKGRVQMAKEWVESQNPSTPTADFYCQTSDIFRARSERMMTEMQNNLSFKDTWPIISSIVGEIGNNSFDHNLGNWPDIPGIFFAYDLGKRTLVLADRGNGVLQTLHRVRTSLHTEADALLVAFTEIVSGRAPENRGNGLKYVKKAINAYQFTFTFQSGNAIIEITGKKPLLQTEPAQTPIHGCLFIMKF